LWIFGIIGVEVKKAHNGASTADWLVRG
jgi:hypothetical protein